MGWEEEEYEPETVGDKLMRKFQKDICKNPTQVIRYCFDGEPLWITSPSIALAKTRNDIPNCPYCSSCRVYEFQLMPNLLSCLQETR